KRRCSVTTADGRQELTVTGMGDVELSCELGEPGKESRISKLILKDVLYVPKIARNLISLGMARKKGLDIFPEKFGYSLKFGSMSNPVLALFRYNEDENLIYLALKGGPSVSVAMLKLMRREGKFGIIEWDT
ncbi:hypothetical protein HDU67_004190, partial [Dinochytrium kinnereticum]